MYFARASFPGLLSGMFLSACFSIGLMWSVSSKTSSSLRLASSPILIPVWRRSSIIENILASFLDASLRALYSVGLRMRGGASSYLGCETRREGSSVTYSLIFKNL